LGDYSIKEILAWIAGMVVATVLVVALVIYAVRFIAPPNPDDPLTKAGGLKADQAPALKKVLRRERRTFLCWIDRRSAESSRLV
jgi:hypothetical protein